MSQVSPEHERLAEHVGRWDVDSTFYADPLQPPVKVRARETIEPFGSFWTTSLFEAEMFGAPFRGRRTLGFDTVTAKYVSTWVDTVSPLLFHFTGTFDASGRVLEMTGQSWDCDAKRMTPVRTAEDHRGPDERVFEMFMTKADGREVKLFTHVYRRAREPGRQPE